MAHSSCGNSSNISGNLNVRNITNSGARLFMTHDLSGFSGGRVSAYIGDDGVTAGDAIRYDVTSGSPSENKYRKAQADAPENAEVVGIVESIDNGVVNVVLSGQIVYPSSRLINATHIDETLGTSGATGGNDIYFLSEVTAGAIQNLAPSEPTRIAKPILQQAADGTFSHHVVNYIGYQIGGSVVASTEEDPNNVAMASVLDMDGTLALNSNQFDASITNYVPMTVNSPSFTTKTFEKVSASRFKNDPFGARWCFTADTSFSESLWLNKTVWFVDSSGARTWKGKVVQINDSRRINTKCVYVTTIETSEPNIALKLHSASGEKISITSSEKTCFALPRVDTQQTSLSVRNVNGQKSTIRRRDIITLSSDQGDMAAHVPDKVSVNDLTVTNSVTLENSTHSISDVTATIKALSDEMTSIRREVNGLSTSASTSASNITAKS